MVGEDYEIAAVEELSEEGSRVIAEIRGREVAVFNVGGEYHAMLNYCPHASGPLCDGPTTGRFEADPDSGRMTYDDEERYVQCPWHDWKFDITTGKNVHSNRYAVPTFETSVEDGSVYVRM